MSNDTESPDFPDFPDFADLPEDANALSTTPAPGSEFAAPEGFRSGFISFVGRPNTGKSTLTNALVGEKIAITADQPETTRHPIRGVVHRPDSQIIVVAGPTPGPDGQDGPDNQDPADDRDGDDRDNHDDEDKDPR